MPANVEQYLGRTPAWHRIGTAIKDEDISAEDAIFRMGVDYDIEKVRLMAETGPGEFRFTGKYGLVRRGNTNFEEAFLGVVGEDYTFAQNRDIARIVDTIRGDTGWKVETVGTLGNGNSIFMTLAAGKDQIAGQDVNIYYLINENRGNGKALRLAYTPVIVVCQNTLELGLQQALIDVSMFHGKNFGRELEWRASLVAKMKQAREDTNAKIERLTLARVVDSQIDEILERVYVSPAEPKAKRTLEELDRTGQLMGMDAILYKSLDDSVRRAEGWRERLKGYKELAKQRFEAYNDEQAQDSSTRGTAFALLMAITECEDWRTGKDSTGSQLFGYRAQNKARAFAALSQFADRQLAGIN